jgi:ferrochelatase
VIEDQGLVKLVLNGIACASAHAARRDYAKIWNHEKNRSPLKTITRSQAEKLAHAEPGPAALSTGNARPSLDRGAADRPRGARLRRILIVAPIRNTAPRRRDRLSEVFRVLTACATSRPSASPRPFQRPVLSGAGILDQRRARQLDPSGYLASFHGVPPAYVDSGDPYYAIAWRRCGSCMRTEADEGEIAADVPIAPARPMARAGDRTGPSRRWQEG